MNETTRSGSSKDTRVSEAAIAPVGPVGPWDFATRIAGSFGRLLPVVVVLLFLATLIVATIYGAYKISDHLISLNRSLYQALEDKHEAELISQSAAISAKNSALEDYSKRLKALTDQTMGVATKVNNLVNGQLAIMTELSSTRKSAIDQYQTQISEKEKELTKLRITVEKERGLAELALFESARRLVISELERGPWLSDDGGRILQEAMNKTALAQAQRDFADQSLPWQWRLMVASESYRQLGGIEKLDLISKLLVENKHQLNRSIEGYITGSGRKEYSRKRRLELMKVFAPAIVADELPVDFRTLLLESQLLLAPDVRQLAGEPLDAELLQSIASFGVQAINNLDVQKNFHCYEVESLLRAIRRVSETAVAVHAKRISNHAETPNQVKACTIAWLEEAELEPPKQSDFDAWPN